MAAFVLDTNVLLVADRQHPDVSPACVLACLDQLRALHEAGQVVLDDQFEIIKEYQHKLDYKQGKSVAQVFLKTLLQNPARRRLVRLVAHPVRGFVSFPDDPDLAAFDPADRKFIAAAAAAGQRPAPILQAADSKWLLWSAALERHGLAVIFLCRDDLERFARNKGLARR